ncbi:MAG: hypothetical protein NTY51_05545 [Deltaproteobacteria bacterium]|nr:hypothetical protein [Deltaproteobacteria bacterium]
MDACLGADRAAVDFYEDTIDHLASERATCVTLEACRIDGVLRIVVKVFVLAAIQFRHALSMRQA